jgi:hypothetical protein
MCFSTILGVQFNGKKHLHKVVQSSPQTEIVPITQLPAPPAG